MEVVIFSGFNQRAIIAFLRTLKKNNVSFSIIASSNMDPILLTEYKKNVVNIRDSIKLDIKDLLNSIEKVKKVKNAKKIIIAPSTEALNRFLLKHRERIENLNCIIPLVRNEIYYKISDKYTFSLLCKENNILVPEEYNIEAINVFPIVAKPKTYFAMSNNEVYEPIIVHDYNELTIFKEKYNKKNFYFQQYIPGKSMYLLYYFYKNGQIRKFSQENLIQQPEGKSIVAAISSNFHNSNVSKKFEELFRKINYFGLIMVEIKESNSKFYMIEANPRFWGPSQLFVDAGVNLFEDFLLENNVINDIINVNLSNIITKYFWYGGMIDVFNKKKELIFHNYSYDEFINSFKEWLSVEIYRRDDTMKIFNKESEFVNGHNTGIKNTLQ